MSFNNNIMRDLPQCVKQEFLKFVPNSLTNDITCFTFYDNHPRFSKKVDIIVCTSQGEIIELFQRNIMSKISIKTSLNPTEICIYRNTLGNQYYLIRTSIELFIIHKKMTMELIKKLDNVEKFTLEDASCSGQVCLRVWLNEDALPLDFDENFENVTENSVSNFIETDDDTLPAINALKSKLNEVMYTRSSNEEAFNELLNLRQTVAYSMYCNMYPELSDVIFKRPLKQVIGTLRVQLEMPWVKLCNQKIVMVLNIFNDSTETLNDIEVIVHDNNKKTLEYETKFYEACTNAPYWTQCTDNKITTKSNATLAVIVNMKELKYFTDKIEFKGVILYKLKGKQKMLPFEDVVVSHMDMFDQTFDVLSSKTYGAKDILAIIATTIQTDLSIRHIPPGSSNDLMLFDVFSSYLKMEPVTQVRNMVIHRLSPHHVLNGVMILWEDMHDNDKNLFKITVFTRSQSQVLLLIHYINDAIPHRLVVTLPSTQISLKRDLGDDNLQPQKDSNAQNILDYGQSLKNQMTLILKFYDDCIMKMGESKNPEILNKIGTEIDLLAGGQIKYKEFAEMLKEEMLKGIDSLNAERDKKENDDILMIID